MRIGLVRAIAKSKGVNSARLKKADIVRAIQTAEGNFPCYGTAVDGFCDQQACLWREDCLPADAAPRTTA